MEPVVRIDPLTFQLPVGSLGSTGMGSGGGGASAAGAVGGGVQVPITATATLVVNPEGGPKVYQCRFCEYSSNASASVVTHERRHTGEKPFSCAFCPYTAARKGQVRLLCDPVRVLVLVLALTLYPSMGLSDVQARMQRR